jgi:murein DD-endopeptidase MepM/ murein hydrolase activator NlpD
MKRLPVIIFSTLAVVGLVTGYLAYRSIYPQTTRTQRLLAWLRNPKDHSDWAVQSKRYCNGAPFSIPTDGYIGYLWGDRFKLNHEHQGIDIFAGTPPGVTPVFAVYDGYLTRQQDWVSSVIQRIPKDPLFPERQIWVYYTHMADAAGASFISIDFPPGTDDRFITAGTLIGYQGNYSGTPGNPTGVHLHLSLVRSDATGLYKNELDISNTLDPSPYFLLPLNSSTNHGEIPICPET